MPFIAPRIEAMEYDGTNGEFIASEWLGDTKFISDDGETLVMAVPVWPTPEPREFPKGYVVFRTSGSDFNMAIPSEDYAKGYVTLPDPPTQNPEGS